MKVASKESRASRGDAAEPPAGRSSRRRSPRLPVDASVQLQLSKSLAIFARATEVSRTGIRIRLHGGARPGQRYRVVLQPGGPSEAGVDAEVRWVGKPDLDGGHPVGMRWLDVPGRSQARVAEFVREALPSR